MTFLENRVAPPFVMLIVAGAMLLANFLMGASAPGGVWLIIAIVLALLGICVAIAGRNAFVRVGTTLNPINLNAATQLVTTGIYNYTRNPMYLGLTVLLVAIAALFANPWLLIGPVIFVLFIQRFQIMPEERVMLAKFGKDYLAYQHRVRRWI